MDSFSVGDRVLSYSLQCCSGEMGIVREIRNWYAWVQFDSGVAWRAIDLKNLGKIEDSLQTPAEKESKPAIAELPPAPVPERAEVLAAPKQMKLF